MHDCRQIPHSTGGTSFDRWKMDTTLQIPAVGLATVWRTDGGVSRHYDNCKTIASTFGRD